MMAYSPNLTPDGSSEFEFSCETAYTGTFYTGTYVTGSYVTGTYYVVTQVIDVTIHTGTYMRIREGTYADYHSQELADDNANRTSVDVYAIEGEWKIVESNENNIMVVDVSSFPISRGVQYIGAKDNDRYNTYAFPHHHMAPTALSGTSSLFYSNPSYYIYGLTTHGDYTYFLEYYSLSNLAIVRKSMISGAESKLTESALNLLGYTFGELEFVVIDDNTIMIELEVLPYSSKIWATYDFSTAQVRLVCLPIMFGSLASYYWHWAIIGHKLCIAGWGYDEIGGDSAIVYFNYIYDYTQPYGTPPIASLQVPKWRHWSNMQYPVCNDMIVKKKFFCEYHTGYTPDVEIDPGFEDRTSIFIFDTENDTIVESIQKIDSGGGEGAFYMYHLCENPFNGMLYYLTYHVYDAGAYYMWSYSIQIMSPDNYSHTTFYEYQWLNDPPYTDRDISLTPRVLIPGMFDLFVMMENGDIYRVRDLPGAIGNPLCTIEINWEYPNGGTYGPHWYEPNMEMPQPDKHASVLDRWDRLWYIDGSYIKAINIITGQEEISMDAGITNVWFMYRAGLFTNYGFQHVYLARDRVVVLCHNDYDSVHTDITSYIYLIE